MAVGVLVAAAALLRQQGVPAMDSVWAEDGGLFLTDALRGSGDLLAPYSGYVHLVPRALAWLVAQLPIAYAALGLALASAATVGLLAAYVARSLSPHVGLPTAAVAALPMGLHPWLGPEVLANLANLHWFFVMAAAVPVLLPEVRRDLPVSSVVVVVLTVLTSGVAILLMPLALLPRLRRDVRGAPDAVEVVVGLGALGLAAVLLANPDASAPQGLFVEPVRITRLLAVRGIGGIAFGRQMLRSATEAGLVWPAVVLFVLATAYLVVRAGPVHRRVGGRLLLGAVALSAGILLVRGPNVRAVLDWTVGATPDSGSRYIVIPAVLGMTGLIVLLASPTLRSADLVRIATVGVLLLAVTIDVRASSQRSDAPGWGVALEAACDAGQPQVQIPPRRSSREWVVELPEGTC